MPNTRRLLPVVAAAAIVLTPLRGHADLALPSSMLAPAAPQPEPDDITVACGSRTAAPFRRAAADHCTEPLMREERLACRVILHALDHCADGYTITGRPSYPTLKVNDPRDPWFVWRAEWRPLVEGGYELRNIDYLFDDCDAGGTPPEPKGPVKFHPVRQRHRR